MHLAQILAHIATPPLHRVDWRWDRINFHIFAATKKRGNNLSGFKLLSPDFPFLASDFDISINLSNIFNYSFYWIKVLSQRIVGANYYLIKQ